VAESHIIEFDTGGMNLAYFESADGTGIFYKDWGAGRPILFAHGWPLTADMWDRQMMFFGERGFRVVAFDRRGFGRSGQNWNGNTYENSADDLAGLITHLELEGVVLVGHSMAGGEFATYVARHGTGKLAGIVTSGGNLPQILQTEKNPAGFPIGNFDEMRAGVLENRSGFLKTMPKTPFGFNKLTHRTDEGWMDWFWRQGMMAGVKPMFDFIAEFSERDFSGDLGKIDVPVLIIHGDDDQGTPIAATAERAAAMIPRATLKVYQGGTHMIPVLNADAFNADILAFIESLAG
jgi:non-heme chloroperoxidase